MNINSNKIFQIVLILYVPVVWKLNQLFTFFYSLCFSSIHKILFNELISICKKFIDLPDSSKVELLLYGSPYLSFTQNSSIINAYINYIIKSECFKGDLFRTYFNPKLYLNPIQK